MTTKPKPQAATFFGRPLRGVRYVSGALELCDVLALQTGGAFNVSLSPPVRHLGPPAHWNARLYASKKVARTCTHHNPHTALRMLERETRQLLADLRELVDEEEE